MSSCGVRLSVCLSRSWVAWKRIGPKGIFEIFSPSGSQAILVFHAKRDGDIPTEIPLTGASNAGGVGKKTRFWTNIWLRCIIVNRTSREVWKIKPRRTAASVEITAASVVRCSHKTTTKCLWRARRYTPETKGGQTPPPDTTPLVITPFSAAVGQNPAGIFCWKLTLTRTTDPIRPTRRGPDLNRPTNASKQGGLWPRGICPGGFGRTPPETIGDSRTEFNIILCIVNLKPHNKW